MQPRIVVTRERPWRKTYWVAGGVFLLAISAWGLYSYTRASTVSDFARAKLEVEELREERRRLTRELREAREESAQLREQVVYVQRSTEIDTQACDDVRTSLGALQAEAADLREQLAFYRGIVAPEQARAGVRVQQLTFSPGGTPGGYRYDLVLIQSVRHDKRVEGKIDLQIVGRQGSAERRYSAAELVPAGAGNLVFSLKYFEEFSGVLNLPQGFTPSRVIVVLIPSAGGAPKIEESFDWSRVLSGGGT